MDHDNLQSISSLTFIKRSRKKEEAKEGTVEAKYITYHIYTIASTCISSLTRIIHLVYTCTNNIVIRHDRKIMMGIAWCDSSFQHNYS